MNFKVSIFWKRLKKTQGPKKNGFHPIDVQDFCFLKNSVNKVNREVIEWE